MFFHRSLNFEDLTLGLRLDLDYDGFWRRSDALEQLELWRKAIAHEVLALPKQQLHLQRIRSRFITLYPFYTLFESLDVDVLFIYLCKRKG